MKLWLIEKILKFTLPLLYWGEWNKKIIIYKINGFGKFKIRVNTYDKFAVLETFETGEYLDSDINIKPDDIVVDIGAHIGAFSVYAAKRANKGRVYAYEPDRENYNILSENISLNNLKNVYLFDKAVSSKKGTLQLFIRETNSMHSIYGVESNKKRMVPTLTLEDILIENKLSKVDFLKIDAEGAEYDILLNTPNNVLKKIDKIILEYHDYLNHKHNYTELKKYLEKNGFHVSLQENLLSRTVGTASVIERLIVIALLSLRKVIKQGTIKAKSDF